MENNTSVSFDNTSIAFASRSDKELRKMYFLFSAMNSRQLTKIGTKIVKTALILRFPVQSIIKNTLFKHFCGGESLEESANTIASLSKFKIRTIPDYSVEGESDDETFDDTTHKVLECVELASQSSDIAFVVFKITGLGAIALLEKIQEGENLDEQELESFTKIKSRVDKICKKAFIKNVRILIDAEESWIQGTIDALAYAMMNQYNREKATVYNTYQMYRTDMLYNLKTACELAKKDKFFLGAKLVRGAYMEKETERALKKDYPNPIYASKAETDESFNEGLNYCLDENRTIYLCCGSHNEDSNQLLLALMKKKNIPRNDPSVCFAQLYGMGDHISYNLAEAGYNVAKYLPFGPVKSVLPYLFRRAEENKSVTGQTSRELSLIKKEMQRRGLFF